jgi:hypothetical protein
MLFFLLFQKRLADFVNTSAVIHKVDILLQIRLLQIRLLRAADPAAAAFRLPLLLLLCEANSPSLSDVFLVHRVT